MQIVADDKIPFLKGVLEPFAQMIYLPGKDINKSHLKSADALIVRTRTHCNASLLAGTAVKAVATATIGTDHLDTEWMESHGVQWTNAPGCNSGSVKQYIASVFARLITSGIDLQGKTLGIVGVGNVGRKIQKVGQAFGMNILLNDPPRREAEPDFEDVSLNALLQQSDIVTFHVPLTYGEHHPTFHLFNEETMRLLKKGTIVINSSRGEVVDSKVLLKGLDSGAVKSAILDVWENEPNISKQLHEKLLMGTPHIAGYSVDGKANGTAAAVQFIAHCFNLPLTGWFPGNLPEKENKILKIEPGNDDDNILLAKTVLQTYDVMEDHIRLKAIPADFEKLRGSYPARREFPYYRVKVDEGRRELKGALETLGFG